MIRAAVITGIRCKQGGIPSQRICEETKCFLIRCRGISSWATLPVHSSRKIIGCRSLTSGSAKEASDKSENTKKSAEEETQIVLTPGQKVVAASRLTMWAGIFAFASVCAYYIGKELIPT